MARMTTTPPRYNSEWAEIIGIAVELARQEAQSASLETDNPPTVSIQELAKWLDLLASFVRKVETISEK